MTRQERKALTTISDLTEHPRQSSIAIISDELEQLAVLDNDSYGNTRKVLRGETSQATYVAVIEISEGHISYSAKTAPLQHADLGVVELTSHDEDESLIIPRPGYDITARNHEGPNASDEIIPDSSDGDILVGVHSDTETAYPYKELLTCNGMSFNWLDTKAQLIDPEGDFKLPFEPAAREVSEDMWSTTATICADDQDNIYTAMAEDYWT